MAKKKSLNRKESKPKELILRSEEKESATASILFSPYESAAGVPSFTDLLTAEELYGTIVWVYVCVYTIAMSAAGVDFYLADKKTDEYIDNHPLYDVFSNPNPLMSWEDFIEAVFTYLELDGESFVELVWAEVLGKQKLNEMYVLKPSRMTIIPDAKNYIKGYIYNVSGRKVAFDAKDILYIKYMNPLNDYHGLSPVVPSSHSAYVEIEQNRFNRKFFQNDATPGGILKTDHELSREHRKRLREEFERLYRGSRNAHKVAVLDKGLDYKTVTISQRDMQFIEQKRVTREEILAAFGVPPVLVGILDEASYANAYIQQKVFWEQTMIPKLRKFTGAMNRFISKYWKDVKLVYDLSSVDSLQEDKKLKADLHDKYFKMGVMTQNEIREDLGLPPVQGGDYLYLPANLVPIATTKPQKKDFIDMVYEGGIYQSAGEKQEAIELLKKKSLTYSQSQRSKRLGGGNGKVMHLRKLIN